MLLNLVVLTSRWTGKLDWPEAAMWSCIAFSVALIACTFFIAVAWFLKGIQK